MRERFHSDVAVQATELLLQERTPRDVSVAHPRAEEVGTAARISDLQVPEVRRLRSPHDSAPQTHLLSNGRYSVMVTRRGLGLQPLERPGGHALARRRHARRHRQLLPVARLESGRVWSAGYQPCARATQYLRGELHRGSRRNHPRRWRHRDHARGAGLLGGRCRSPARVDQQCHRQRRARSK